PARAPGSSPPSDVRQAVTPPRPPICHRRADDTRPNVPPGGMVDSTQLTDHVRAAFGTACHLESLDRLAGGARKQIYRARLRDPSLGVLVYLWHNEAGYFADRERAGFEDTQTDEQAPLLFDATV